MVGKVDLLCIFKAETNNELLLNVSAKTALHFLHSEDENLFPAC